VWFDPVLDRIWAIGLDLDDQGDLGGLAAALGAAGGELGGGGVTGAGQNGHPGGVSAWDWVREHAGVTANAVASSGRRLGDRNRACDSAWRSKSSGE